VKSGLAIILFSVALTLLAIIGMTWGTFYDIPDYVHTSYGLPFPWATHTTNTIAGATDSWSVSTYGLGADMAFWMGLIAAASLIINRTLGSRQTM